MPRSLLAVLLLVGLILPALAEEPAKDPEPKPVPDAAPTFKDLLKNLAKQMGFQPRGMRSPVALAEARLGAAVEQPSDVLAERLNLPKGQGVLLQEVRADSAAAKAGLNTNDVLLELNRKPVPRDLQEFARLIDDFQARAPIDALVLRQGQKETIKGLSLPEPERNPRFIRGNARMRGKVPEPPSTSSLNIERQPEGGFTTLYQEGAVVIRITGKTADGKTQISEIEIKDGKDTQKYRSVEEVPDDHRDDVKYLLKKTEKELTIAKPKDSNS